MTLPEELQSLATRVLTFSSFGADAAHLIENLNWTEKLEIEKALVVFKSINSLALGYFSSKLYKTI